MEIDVADINRDGNLDIVVGGTDGGMRADIEWWCNNKCGSSWRKYAIGPAARSTDIRLADMDGDGDLDVISSGQSQGSGFSWYENTGSYHENTAWPKEQIDSPAPIPYAIDAGDLDNDGDLDFVGSTANYIGYTRFQDNFISWYENDGAADPSWTDSVIKTKDRSVAPQRNRIVDLDKDGDLDIVASIQGSNYDELVWYENDGAADPSWTENVIYINEGNFSNPKGLEVGDLDNDGDLDILITAKSPRGVINGQVTWFENNGATDPSWTQQTIDPFEDYSEYFWNLSLVDWDNDGDLDILSANGGTQNKSVVWYENAGGNHFSSNNSSLENALNAGTSVTITTTSSSNSYVNSSNVSSGVGNITLKTNLDYTDGSGRLTLNAANAIEISNGYTLKSGSDGLELISSAGLTGSGSIIIDEDNASGDPSLTVEQSSNSTFSVPFQGMVILRKKEVVF